jgi:adenosylhomocysteine nucleosidase
VERTIVYDIVDKMVNPAADTAIARYTTPLDLAWLKEPFPLPVRRSLMLTADRDLVAEEILELKAKYGAIAGDWESGAVAYVAAHNHIPCLILRGVSDLVSPEGGEAYGNYSLFTERAEEIMNVLLASLPAWIAQTQTLRKTGAELGKGSA